MKKFLSLVLALVMTMSLVTISAGAKEFTDDDKITYDEAITVISELGVVDGYTDGSFKPADTLTRGAAAKIICNLILGTTTASELHADTAPFSDVPTTNTFAGYIAYCAKEGIISGYADGTFRPGNTLTGYAFMKMLLGALGYDQDIEGYTGANWSIPVAKRALDIGLNKGLEGSFNGIKAVTREEACLYAFNTLKADLVEYDTSLTVNGSGNLTGLSIAKAQTWNNSATRKDYIKEDNYIQFAEQYFNKLQRDDGEDDFGRPTNEWTYDKKDLGSFVNQDLFVTSYTVKVEGGDIYSDLTSAACEYDLTYWVDGVALNRTATAAEKAKLEKKNEDKMDSTGKGVLTEVYVNNDKEETTIVVINTWLAEVAADYSEKNENVRLNVFAGVQQGSAPTTTTKTYTVSSDDVDGLEDLKEDDMVLVNIADDEVVIVSEVETVEDVAITSYSTDYEDADAKTDYKLTKLTADGTKYETAKKAYEDAEVLYDYAVEQLEDATFDLYLDPYGYVIGARQVDADDKYMFVVGYEQSSSYLASAIDQALVIFTDGTMQTVDIKDNDLSTADAAALNLSGPSPVGNSNVNRWFTYTEKNGVYNLEELVARQIVDNQTQKLDKENVSVVNNGTFTTSETSGATVAHGNNDSVFIAVKADDDVTAAGSIVKVEDVATGIKHSALEVKYDSNLSNYDTPNTDDMIFAIYDKNGYIDYAVVVGKSAGASEKLVYLTSGIKSKSLVDGEYIYTYEAITKDGAVEVQSFEAKDNGTNHGGGARANLALGNLYEASFDKDGVITEMEFLADTPAANLNTAQYKSDGYALVRIGTYGANVTATGAQELYAKGDTLYYQLGDNTRYILLDEDCTFFVRASDDDTDDYQEYGNIKSALSALGEDSYFVGTIAAIVDDAGIATTLILDDWYTANDKQPSNVTPPASYSDGLAERAVFDMANTEIDVYDRVGDGSTPDELAKELLEKNGFEVKSIVGSGDGALVYVIAPNGDAETWTIDVVAELYPISLNITNGNIKLASPSTVWLATSGTGNSITVTVKSTQTTGFGAASYSSSSAVATNCSVTVGIVTRDSNDVTLADFTLTLTSLTAGKTSGSVDITIA